MGKRRKNLRRQQIRSASQGQKSALDVLVPKPTITAPVAKPAPAPVAKPAPAPVAKPAPAPVAKPVREIVHAADLASPRSPKETKASPTIKSSVKAKAASKK
jgi:hypothetical protein